MALVRWVDPFRELEIMRRQMDRLFDEMLRRDDDTQVNRGWIGCRRWSCKTRLTP